MKNWRNGRLCAREDQWPTSKHVGTPLRISEVVSEVVSEARDGEMALSFPSTETPSPPLLVAQHGAARTITVLETSRAPVLLLSSTAASDRREQPAACSSQQKCPSPSRGPRKPRSVQAATTLNLTHRMAHSTTLHLMHQITTKQPNLDPMRNHQVLSMKHLRDHQPTTPALYRTAD